MLTQAHSPSLPHHHTPSPAPTLHHLPSPALTSPPPQRLLRDAHADMERGFASLPASDPPPGVGTLGSSTVGRYPRAAVEKIQGDHRAVLLREFPSYDVQGVLLHMPFGDIEDKLAEVILNTGERVGEGEGVYVGVGVGEGGDERGERDARGCL